MFNSPAAFATTPQFTTHGWNPTCNPTWNPTWNTSWNPAWFTNTNTPWNQSGSQGFGIASNCSQYCSPATFQSQYMNPMFTNPWMQSLWSGSFNGWTPAWNNSQSNWAPMGWNAPAWNSGWNQNWIAGSFPTSNAFQPWNMIPAWNPLACSPTQPAMAWMPQPCPTNFQTSPAINFQYGQPNPNFAPGGAWGTFPGSPLPYQNFFNTSLFATGNSTPQQHANNGTHTPNQATFNPVTNFPLSTPGAIGNTTPHFYPAWNAGAFGPQWFQNGWPVNACSPATFANGATPQPIPCDTVEPTPKRNGVNARSVA